MLIRIHIWKRLLNQGKDVNLYYYKSLNTLTDQGTHNLSRSGTLELWKVLTWPSEGTWPTPHWCFLLGLLLLLCRCCFERIRTVWLTVNFSTSSVSVIWRAATYRPGEASPNPHSSSRTPHQTKSRPRRTVTVEERCDRYPRGRLKRY